MQLERRYLEDAIDAVKEARRRLAYVLREEPLNERAGIWMSRVADDDVQRRDCLMHTLAINPLHLAARAELE